MHDLLLHLICERGVIRLALDLAIAFGSLAVVVAWTGEGVRDRRRRRAEISERRTA
jgi:hypothetical protein